MFSVPSASYNLSTFCSSKFHEHCREVVDGDIPPRIECSKVSHSVSIVQLGNLCINSHLLQREVSMMLTEKDTDIWVWQSIYCFVSLAEQKYYFLPRPLTFLTKDIGHPSNIKHKFNEWANEWVLNPIRQQLVILKMFVSTFVQVYQADKLPSKTTEFVAGLVVFFFLFRCGAE